MSLNIANLLLSTLTLWMWIIIEKMKSFARRPQIKPKSSWWNNLENDYYMVLFLKEGIYAKNTAKQTMFY